MRILKFSAVCFGMTMAAFAMGDEPKKMADPAPAASTTLSINDPAFDRYVDLSTLSAAVADVDAAALTDLALQLAQGEKTLLRSHRAVKAERIFDLAVKAAIEKRDTVTIERLAKGAGALGLKEAAEKISLAKSLASAPRSAKRELNVAIDDLSQESFKALQTWRLAVEAAKFAGNKKALTELVTEAEVIGDFKEGVRKQLKSLAEDALKSVPEGESDDVLEKLVSSSRAAQPQYGFNVGQTATMTIVNRAPGLVVFYINGANGKTLYSLQPGQSFRPVIAVTGVIISPVTSVGDVAVSFNGSPGRVVSKNVSAAPSISIALNPTKNAQNEYTTLATYSLVNGRNVAIIYSPQAFPGKGFGTQFIN
jgi:hypothetical protein